MSASGALVLELDHGPANAIGPDLLEFVASGLERAESEGAPVVLTGSGRFFSAGLDLGGLPEDRGAMGDFVDRFESVLRHLFLFPAPTVAAVNGHAVAGGALLAAACDFRIGAEGGYRVGVSEVSLGVTFPAIGFEILRAVIPRRRRPQVLLRGSLTGPAGAVENGFLHELAAGDELLPRARALANELGALPRSAYAHTKRELRAAPAARAAADREAKRRGFLDSWFSPEVARRRAALLAAKR